MFDNGSGIDTFRIGSKQTVEMTATAIKAGTSLMNA